MPLLIKLKFLWRAFCYESVENIKMDPETTAIQKIESNGNRPEDWLEFLALQRSKTAAGLTDETCQHLLYLYERSVSQIPAEENKKNFSYARLLVDFAKLQM